MKQLFISFSISISITILSYAACSDTGFDIDYLNEDQMFAWRSYPNSMVFQDIVPFF